MNDSKVKKLEERKRQIATRLEQIANLQTQVENGNIPSSEWEGAHNIWGTSTVTPAAFNLGATSNCGLASDPYIEMGTKTKKIFHLPNGDTAPASIQAKLKHAVRELARTVDIIPELKSNSLLSASKFTNTGYVTILLPDAVHIYKGDNIHKIEKEAILRGWRDKPTGLWHVPLELSKIQ